MWVCLYYNGFSRICQPSPPRKDSFLHTLDKHDRVVFPRDFSLLVSTDKETWVKVGEGKDVTMTEAPSEDGRDTTTGETGKGCGEMVSTMAWTTLMGCAALCLRKKKKD